MNLNRRTFIGSTTAGLAGLFDASFPGMLAAAPGTAAAELLEPVRRVPGWRSRH